VVLATEKEVGSFKTLSDVLIERDVKKHTSSSCSEKHRPNLPDPCPGCQMLPWGIMATRSNVSHSNGMTGRGVVACVVDSGVDYNHPDLSANVLRSLDFTGSGDGFDDNGHGTHVSGTIVAVDNGIGVVGVAPGAKVVSMKVLSANGSGWSSDIADGILACMNEGAHVINLSLGSNSPSTIIRASLATVTAAGLVAFCAAGNESTAISYPARHPECHAITSLDEDLKLSFFSNYGMQAAFSGPGGNVLSTVPNGYDYFSGTSMATPHAVGVYALSLSAGGMLRGRDVGLPRDEQGLGLVDALLSISP